MQSTRFSRQVALPGFGTGSQRRLADARVLVIGAGGLGSPVILALAGAGIGTIGIVDDDTVDLSNLHRQLIHGTADVGRDKVTSAAASVGALDPDIAVEPHATRLDSANALDLLGRYDVVVDGSDNFPTRYLAADAATLLGLPLVWGAVSQYSGQVGVATPGAPGYRDLFPVPPAPGSVLSCEEGGVLPTVCGVIGSIMASEVLKLVTGIGRPLIGRVTTYDALSGGFRELAFERDPAAEPLTALIDYELFCGLGDSISPTELATELDSVTLVDIREPWEAEIAAIPGARLVAVDQIEPADDLVVYCHHGVRSARAVAVLSARGIRARQLAGGIDAWSRLVDPTIPRY